MKITEIEISYKTYTDNQVILKRSEQVFDYAINSWNMNTIEVQEEFKVLLLKNNNEVLGIYSLSKGGVTSTVVDLKLLMAVVLKSIATGIILIHNHPSGNLKPSQPDITITNKVKEGCQLFDVILIDHLIISKNNYYSFSDNGEL